jgi:hypothetical protein
LKRLYEAGPKTCLEKLLERFGPIKLVTDDGKLVNSNECTLCDIGGYLGLCNKN